MASFIFSLLDFKPSLNDDGGFASADKKTDGRNLLATKSPQRVEFEAIFLPWVMINGKLQKYGDRYGYELMLHTNQAHAKN